MLQMSIEDGVANKCLKLFSFTLPVGLSMHRGRAKIKSHFRRSDLGEMD
jgi:hypothetical protein